MVDFRGEPIFFIGKIVVSEYFLNIAVGCNYSDKFNCDRTLSLF